MIQATQWRQDSALQPTNPYQRIRFFSTFPSGGQGDSAFAWSPVFNQDIRPVGSPDGFSPYPGFSGAGGLGIGDLSFGAVVAGILAIGGIAFGGWLAKKNLER